jgi:hypothetical protein
VLHADIAERLRPPQPPLIDQYQAPQLIVDAMARHEASHVCVGVALGQRIESVKLSRGADGATRGTTYHTDGLDVIASMIALAAGRAGQQKYGAVGRFYDEWCRDDERQLINLALDLVETQPRCDRKQNALRLIRGAEEAAAKLVDSLWSDIERVACEPVRAEELDADERSPKSLASASASLPSTTGQCIVNRVEFVRQPRHKIFQPLTIAVHGIQIAFEQPRAAIFARPLQGGCTRTRKRRCYVSQRIMKRSPKRRSSGYCATPTRLIGA